MATLQLLAQALAAWQQDLLMVLIMTSITADMEAMASLALTATAGPSTTTTALSFMTATARLALQVSPTQVDITTMALAQQLASAQLALQAGLPMAPITRLAATRAAGLESLLIRECMLPFVSSTTCQSTTATQATLMAALELQAPTPMVTAGPPARR
jgi:hypothetical protein